MKALLELVPNANKEDQIFPCLFFLLSFSPFAHSFERSSRKLSLRCDVNCAMVKQRDFILDSAREKGFIRRRPCREGISTSEEG